MGVTRHRHGEELTLMPSKNGVQVIEMSRLVRWFEIGCSAGDAAVAGNPHSA
jgi:hypothetical protein